MKAFIVHILIFASFSAFGQKRPIELGIGFAVASNPYQFENGNNYDNIFLDKELKIKIDSNTSKNLAPFICKPDYGLYNFICLSKTTKYYQILINDIFAAYIPNDSNFYFVTWDLILQNFLVDRITKDNPIKEHPSINSNSLIYNCKNDLFQVKNVIEIENEYWIKILFPTSCEINTKSEFKYGWIKWREKNNLLIRFLL